MKHTRTILTALLLAPLTALHVVGAPVLPGLTYHPDGDAIVIRNGTRWDNRPLYCNQRQMVVNAGEMPGLSGALGTLRVAVRRGDVQRQLDQCGERVARYRPGRMEWEVSDPKLPGLTVTMLATTIAEGDGFTVRVRSKGAKADDELLWLFTPASATNAPPAKPQMVADAFRIGKVFATLSDKASENFVVPLTDNTPHDFAVSGTGKPIPATRAFEDGLVRVERLGRQVVVETPDAYFDAGVGASCAAMYGLYVGKVFVHGGSKWRAPYLGWRVMDGATAYGWHDLVMTAAKDHGSRQVTSSTKVAAEADSFGAEQSQNSRFYGLGKIMSLGTRYDMQTQFFDQSCREWRATGDAAFEKLLLPMLELHLQWAKECFDPDDDGLYESYINTWPTDSQWYNGGGTVEESAYIYYQRRAAADLCRRAGRSADAAKHDAEADKIRAAVDRVLWLKNKGQYAAYIEQGGHKRVHDDAWVYSQHLPIEAGMATPQQAWQAMYYTDWAMERFRLPYGGEMRQTSNWVPSQWSVRELYHGDNFAMALGYFLAGQGDEGWELLRGAMVESMYGDPTPKNGYGNERSQASQVNLISPGGLSHPNCSIDFNDITSMFCRAVVEGLFGYRPDYPNGFVRIEPAFPQTWEHASIKTPDFALSYRNNRYQLTLIRSAAVKFRLPVRATKVKRVLVNSQPVRYTIEPWAGYGALFVDVPACNQTEIAVETEGEVVTLPVAEKTGNSPRLLIAKVDGDVPRYQLTKIRAVAPVVEPIKVPAGATWQTLDISRHFNGDVRTIFKQKYVSPRPATVSCRIGYDGWSGWTFQPWKIPVPEITLDSDTTAFSPVYEADNAQVARPTGAATIEAWVVPGPMPTGGGRIVDRTTPGTYHGYMLDTYPGNSLRLITANGDLTARNVLTPGKPAHVAGVYDPAQRIMRLCLNGKEVAAKSSGDFPALIPVARPVRIGGSDAVTNRFVGEIRRAAVHDRALTAEELANRSDVSAAPATTADWKFDAVPAGFKRISADPTAPVQAGRIVTPQGVPFARPNPEKNIAFTSLWDNWSRNVTVPVNARGDAVWLLVCGSTNPMQGRIANAVLRFRYADGAEEKLELVPPLNFWSLCGFGRVDYSYKRDGFALPKEPPPQVQLGQNCRAMVYGQKLRPGVALKDVTLETLSQEVVIGLMGLTIMNHNN